MTPYLFLCAVLSVKKVSFRNIRGTALPSPAARATRDWSLYADSVEVPALVLMENMGPEAANILFLTANNLDILLTPERTTTSGGSSSASSLEVVNSQVMHVSLDEQSGRRSPLVQEPLIVLFRHVAASNVTRPRCAHWDTATAAWSDAHCRLGGRSNDTHTECQCHVLGTLGLLEQVEADPSSDDDGRLARMTTLVVIIVTVTVSLVAVFSIFLLIVYCQRVKVSAVVSRCQAVGIFFLCKDDGITALAPLCIQYTPVWFGAKNGGSL